MPRIILIGDSIRIGYQDIVRRELAGPGSEIWTLDQNGQESRNVLAHFREWVIAPFPDLVHINYW